MALNSDGKIPTVNTDKPKKSGLDLSQRVKTKPKQYEYESTDTDTPTYTPAHTRNPNRKERKTERLQLSVTPSMKERFTRYAVDNDTSMNEVVHALIEKHLDDSGY